MSSQQTSLYIKIEKNSVVRDRNVRLSDVAKMTGTDTAMIRQLKQMSPNYSRAKHQRLSKPAFYVS